MHRRTRTAWVCILHQSFLDIQLLQGILLKKRKVCVLSAGIKFLYVLPGFDVLGVELRHIKTKGWGKMGTEEQTYDIFIRNDVSLCRTYPTVMIVKDLTVVKVSNFLYNIALLQPIK